MAQLTSGSALLRFSGLQDLHPGARGAFTPVVMGSEWGMAGRFSVGCLQDAWPGVRGTGEFTALAAVAAAGGGFGMVFRTEGTATFRESLIGIGYARPLSSTFRIGIRIDRYAVGTASSGMVVAWPVDVALSWRAGAKVLAGISVYDPFRVSMPVKYGVPPPRMVRALLGFRVGEGLGLVMEWESMERRGPSLAVLLSYQYGPSVSIRVGWQSAGAQPVLMVGWTKKGLCVTVGVGWHPALGGRYGLSCDWSSPKKEGV